jgi:hypothetical protein
MHNNSELDSSTLSETELDDVRASIAHLLSQCFGHYQSYRQLEDHYRGQKSSQFTSSMLEINSNMQQREIDTLFLKLEAGFNYDLDEMNLDMTSDTGSPVGKTTQTLDFIEAILHRMEVLENELAILAMLQPYVTLGEKGMLQLLLILHSLDIVFNTAELINQEMVVLEENIFFSFEMTTAPEDITQRFTDISSRIKTLSSDIGLTVE